MLTTGVVIPALGYECAERLSLRIMSTAAEVAAARMEVQ